MADTAAQGEDPRVENVVRLVVRRMQDCAAMPLDEGVEVGWLRPLIASLFVGGRRVDPPDCDCETCRALKILRRDVIEPLERENAELRESNTLLNRRVTKAEAIVAQRVEEQERKGKSLGRSLANAGYYALKAENHRFREALTKIAMVCCMNAFAADKNVWCKPEEGKHSCYCAEGIARAALDPSSTGSK